jgi:hypothetical protein
MWRGSIRSPRPPACARTQIGIWQSGEAAHHLGHRLPVVIDLMLAAISSGALDQRCCARRSRLACSRANT